jgi:hypothetical protein
MAILEGESRTSIVETNNGTMSGSYICHRWISTRRVKRHEGHHVTILTTSAATIVRLTF